MKRILLTLSLFTAVLQPELRGEEKPPHPLEGAWIGQEIVEGGKKMDQAAARAYKMVFRGAKVSLTTEGGNITGTIQLDDSKNPKWMDIKFSMDGAVMTIPAIYEVRDGNFRLCHPEGEGGKRPTAIEVSDGVVLATFKNQQVESGSREVLTPDPHTTGRTDSSSAEASADKP